jgi:hypothetical protein
MSPHDHENQRKAKDAEAEKAAGPRQEVPPERTARKREDSRRRNKDRTAARSTRSRPQISEDEPRSAQEEQDRFEQDYEI